MPRSIVAFDACPACRAVVTHVKASTTVHLVTAKGFSIRRRGRLLIIWDLATGKPHVVPLELRGYHNERRTKFYPRYRVRSCLLWRFTRLWSILKDAGLFLGNTSALKRGGYLYLNRLVAGVGGLFTRDGHASLSWFRDGDRRTNHVVHHRDGNTLDDRIENLEVMWHDEHDRHHDRNDAIAKCFVPFATLLKARAIPVLTLGVIDDASLREGPSALGEQPEDANERDHVDQAAGDNPHATYPTPTNLGTALLGSPDHRATKPPRYPYSMPFSGRRTTQGRWLISPPETYARPPPSVVKLSGTQWPRWSSPTFTASSRHGLRSPRRHRRPVSVAC